MEGGWFSLGLSFFPLLHLHRGGGGGGGELETVVLVFLVLVCMQQKHIRVIEREMVHPVFLLRWWCGGSRGGGDFVSSGWV